MRTSQHPHTLGSIPKSTDRAGALHAPVTQIPEGSTTASPTLIKQLFALASIQDHVNLASCSLPNSTLVHQPHPVCLCETQICFPPVDPSRFGGCGTKLFSKSQVLFLLQMRRRRRNQHRAADTALSFTRATCTP